MWLQDKYFYSVCLHCVYPLLSHNPLHFSIQTPCYSCRYWANTAFVFMVVSTFTSFLWCHVCFLPALLYLCLCWEPWASVGSRPNILCCVSRSITTIRVSVQTHCSNLETDGGKADWKERGWDLGLQKTVLKNSTPWRVPPDQGENETLTQAF